MPFAVIQAGTSLQSISTAGALTTLTLPTGVTLSSSLAPRFAIFNRYVVMVNSSSRPITIDAAGTVRPLTPKTPATKMTLATSGSSTLSGTFLAKQTFLILDDDGNIIAESDYGPLSGSSGAITSAFLSASDIDLSTDTSSISGSRLYRTVTLGDGSTLFPWVDLDGNTQISVIDDLADASLSLVAAPTLGAAPDLTLIAEWRGRLWGAARNRIDYIRWSEAGLMYAWPATNEALVPKLGADSRGVIALAARKEALGIGRRNGIHQVVGTETNNFRIIKVAENAGIESQESVAVHKDEAFFLWKDGVYQWGAGGLKNISDGSVRSWFTTDTYFNRARFQYAFAMIDTNRLKYRLFLANAGDSVENRWVEYDLQDKTWWGPHKTDAVTTLTSAFIIPDADDVLLPVIGNSTGYVWKEQSTATDSTATGIAFDALTKFHDENTPDIEKYWGHLSVLGKAQSAGTLTITPTVGYLNASAGTAISHTMSTGREKLRRLGRGKMVRLNLTHSTAGQPVEIYGYEIPNHEIGRR